MKKLFSLLTVLCMLSSLVTINASAAVEGTMEGWSCSESSPISLVEDEVNGAMRTVLKWNYGNGVESVEGHQGGSGIAYNLGTVPAGTYRISLLINTPYNPGGSWFGFKNDSNGGFPDNSKSTDFAKRHTDEYNLVTRDVVVINEVENQELKLMADWGDSMYLYIAEAKVQQILEDGSLGENLVSNADFTVKNYTDYWNIDGDYEHSVQKMNVDGKWANVLKVVYRGELNGSTNLGADVGVLETGNYKLSAKIYSPHNPGNRWFGFSGQRKQGVLPTNTTFETVELTQTVSNNRAIQNISFGMEYGTNRGEIYITDVECRRIYDDGTLGENRVLNPCFTENPYNEADYQEEYFAVKGWNPTRISDKEFNFTVRETTGMDGALTKALTAYKAAGKTGFILFGQGFPTKANATYRVTFDAKRTGAALYVGTRMAQSQSGDLYTNLQQIGTGAADWATYTFDYAMGDSDVANNALYFSVEGESAAWHQLIYFDNVSVCEVLSDGSLGENMIYNGDFEVPMQSVTDAYFDIVDSDGESMTGGEGFNSIPDVDLGENKLVAITNVTNNENAAYTVDFVVAVYKGGKLYHVDIVPVTAEKGETVKGEWVLGLPETLGNGDVLAKAFVWDSTNGMKPLTGISSIAESEAE